MIYSFTQHTGWIAALILFLLFVLWFTWEAHIAPTEQDDSDDIKIDDLY